MNALTLLTGNRSIRNRRPWLTLLLAWLIVATALSWNPSLVAAQVPLTCVNKTTADGLGNNGVIGVYASGSTIYAATFGGLSISTDSGASFTNRTTIDGLGNNILFGVYAIGSTVYAATNGGLSISTNGGASFTTKTTADGLGADRVNGVYVSGSTVYAATNGGLTICAPLPPEIDLQGNGVSIANGDSTPTSVDGSDLGHPGRLDPHQPHGG